MKLRYILLLAGIILGCQQHSPRALKQLLKQFESELPRVFPDYAAAMGMPQATDILIIPTREAVKKNLDFCQKYLKTFEKFEPLDDLTELNEQRIEKIEILTGMIKQMTGIHSPFNDPGFYNVYPALAWRISEINQNPDSTNTKLLEKTLKKVPVYFSHAKSNLEDPNIPNTAAAIEIQEKTMEFLRITVVEHIRSLPETEYKIRLELAQETAQIAVKDYSVFCKSILVELKKLE